MTAPQNTSKLQDITQGLVAGSCEQGIGQLASIKYEERLA
jgi:hypothetical protein